jgi:hypothetical protein
MDFLPSSIDATNDGGSVVSIFVVDPTKGMMILCSPTDYSREYELPGPSINSTTDFQETAATALLHEIPVVVLSPRFVSFDEAASPLGGFSGTISQHGYQQAGYYGGSEPPKGMSPWLMQDFFSPSYSWISWVASPSASRINMTNPVMNKVRLFRCIFNPEYMISIYLMLLPDALIHTYMSLGPSMGYLSDCRCLIPSPPTPTTLP